MSDSSITSYPVDKSLRTRLLLASLLIAVVVSVISMLVAYGMSADLGESYEIRSLKSNADTILLQLKRATSPDSVESIIQDTVTVQDNLSDASPILLMITVGKNSYFSPGADDSMFKAIQASSKFRSNSHDMVEFEGQQKMWIQREAEKGNIELILICDTEFFDKTLHYIATRLSVTAFLTFWIAVWGALIMSAMIMRRLEVHNKMQAHFAENMAHLAMHDSLTKLPNRFHLINQVEKYIKLNTISDDSQVKQKSAALLFIDLDRFKEVNDAMGHAVGDELLVALSAQLRTELDDSLFVSRIGGDEFVVWCEDTEEEAAVIIANQVIQCCRRSVLVNNMYLGLGASIGIAMYPEHGEDVHTLLKSADISMYKAKKSRLGVKVFSDKDNTLSNFNIRLNHDFNSAIKESQIELFYQTKIDLKNNQIVGVEALSRWIHPELGMIQPNDFISLVEQGGLINEFSRYVIDKAIKQIRIWSDQGLNMKIAVNLSPYNLADPGLVGYIQMIFEKYQVSPEMLEFELTETATMIDIETTQRAFKALKALGVMLSIDDYGTGMSSLAYLKELDVDCIKMDRSFVSNMIEDPRDKVIVQSTISMILELGKKVVAEGIETSELSDQLKKMNCSYGQGYYFSRPTSAEVLTPLLLESSMVAL